ncbi:MAG: FHA domain-containing protein [Planctomycetes bacterium]|nr:FHA domain-containing protein [Planctomycetota bacterium]
MAKISVMFGSNVESEHNLDRDEMKIGRAMDCEIMVDNLGVSRHHCTIVREGDNWVVVDGGSNNGTFVGGQKIKRHTLKHADRVVLGKHSLLFDQHGSVETGEAGGKKKGPAGMGGEMTMFVDQAALAKVMSTKRMGLALQQGGREVLVPLIREETTIGSKGADVPCKAFLVKAIQAKVVRAGEGHRVVSSGGWRSVKVNGAKVSTHDLKAGDVILIAGHTFAYKQA